MISLFTIIAFFIAVYLMNKAFFGFRPSGKRVDADLSKFRTGSHKWKEELVPWQNEEIELVSFNHKVLVKKKGFGKEQEGIIQSIYEEPMVYYRFKDYPGSKENSMLLVKTAKYEFVFRTKKENTKVFIDEQYLGTINSEGLFFQEGKKQILGKIEKYKFPIRPLQIGKRVIGHITFPESDHAVNPRAFYLEKSMNDNERIIFMALGIFEIIRFIIQK